MNALPRDRPADRARIANGAALLTDARTKGPRRLHNRACVHAHAPVASSLLPRTCGAGDRGISALSRSRAALFAIGQTAVLSRAQVDAAVTAADPVVPAAVGRTSSIGRGMNVGPGFHRHRTVSAPRQGACVLGMGCRAAARGEDGQDWGELVHIGLLVRSGAHGPRPPAGDPGPRTRAPTRLAYASRRRGGRRCLSERAAAPRAARRAHARRRPGHSARRRRSLARAPRRTARRRLTRCLSHQASRGYRRPSSPQARTRRKNPPSNPPMRSAARFSTPSVRTPSPCVTAW